jgi:hydrogenase nickel incorporation protein HypA/HybF
MHEFGLCEAILDSVARRAVGRQVIGVRVRIGARHDVVEEAFDQAFSLAALGTVAEGARVEWIVVPARARCRTCGWVAETRDIWATCGRCGSDDLDVEGGDELTLESIEVWEAGVGTNGENRSRREGDV